MGFPVTNAGGLSKLLVLTLSIAMAILRESFRSLLLHSLECGQEDEEDEAPEQQGGDEAAGWTFRPEVEAAFYASLARRFHEQEQQQEQHEAIRASLPSHIFRGEIHHRGISHGLLALGEDAASRNGGEGDDGAQQCAVCLCEFCDGQEVRQLPACGHTFHRDCIDAWLRHAHSTCPLCRASFIAMAPPRLPAAVCP